MQLTNDQIKAVSEWMKEHGIDEHLIGKFEGDWMKYIPRDEKEQKAYLAEIGFTPTSASEYFREEEEMELQRLVRKIKYLQYTHADMEKADALTRKKWKSQGIG